MSGAEDTVRKQVKFWPFGDSVLPPLANFTRIVFKVFFIAQVWVHWNLALITIISPVEAFVVCLFLNN